jgi:hypothetical protein
VSGSLTRRQLLIRTGGASVALVCLGALPGGAIAEPAALSAERAATYAALLEAVDADPSYALVPRDRLVASFAARYAGDESLRACADPILDALAVTTLPELDGFYTPDALALAAAAFEPPEDTHTVDFTV